MRVVARHDGAVLTKDSGRPVEVLPRRFPLEFFDDTPEEIALRQRSTKRVFVREITAEIVDAVARHEPGLGRKTMQTIETVTMGTLARYEGVLIINDPHMPVEPLP